jgi:hypothetical protein
MPVQALRGNPCAEPEKDFEVVIGRILQLERNQWQ